MYGGLLFSYKTLLSRISNIGISYLKLTHFYDTYSDNVLIDISSTTLQLCRTKYLKNKLLLFKQPPSSLLNLLLQTSFSQTPPLSLFVLTNFKQSHKGKICCQKLKRFELLERINFSLWWVQFSKQ